METFQFLGITVSQAAEEARPATGASETVLHSSQPQKNDKIRLRWTGRTAEIILGTALPTLKDLQTTRTKARKSLLDPAHPAHHLFQRLPSGKRYHNTFRAAFLSDHGELTQTSKSKRKVCLSIFQDRRSGIENGWVFLSCYFWVDCDIVAEQFGGDVREDKSNCVSRLSNNGNLSTYLSVL